MVLMNGCDAWADDRLNSTLEEDLCFAGRIIFWSTWTEREGKVNAVADAVNKTEIVKEPLVLKMMPKTEEIEAAEAIARPSAAAAASTAVSVAAGQVSGGETSPPTLRKQHCCCALCFRPLSIVGATSGTP